MLVPAECLQLLAGARLGRVAITVNALAVILPVPFALDRDEILFRAPTAWCSPKQPATMRDEHMHGADFLDVPNHPQMVF